MNNAGEVVRKHADRPQHPVPRKYVDAILYLADRMSQHDRIQPPPGKRAVDELAELLGTKDFRRQQWYRHMNDRQAIESLDLATVRRATLVVMSLVLKVDTSRGEAAKQYFTQVREAMGAEPISVPADVEEHMELAVSYLVG